MTTKIGLQAAISGALDAVLATRPDTATNRHRAEFERVWAQLGYPNNPALKRRAFASLAPRFAAWDARDDLRRALVRAEHRNRIEAARALGSRQGRALALQERGTALLAALDRRVAALPERKRWYSPVPMRVPIA